MFSERLPAGFLEIKNYITPVSLPADTHFLQFSGGTTGTQKCVVITGTMLEKQLGRLCEALAPGERDSVVSRLPLNHDMGLIACQYFPL